MSKQRRGQQNDSTSGVSGAVGPANAQDFGSNAAMADELAQGGPQAMAVNAITKRPVSTGRFAMDREWEAVIDKGRKHGISEGDKVTDANGTGRVSEVFTFRAQVRYYHAYEPNDALTVHCGTPWTRAQAEEADAARRAEAGRDANEADRESEYGSRATPDSR